MGLIEKISFQGKAMDALGFEPRAFRMRSGCDATTPCALDDVSPWLLLSEL